MPKTNFKTAFENSRAKIWAKKLAKQNAPVRSFRRAYSEDYADNFAAPGLLSHAAKTFQLLFKNWKLFGGLLLLAVVITSLLVGLLSQETINSVRETIVETSSDYTSNQLGSFAQAGLLLISTVATGGLSDSLSGGQIFILVFVFILLWLVTIYCIRRLLAQKIVTLRDGLYNAFGPLFSSFVIFLVILAEMIPVFLVLIFLNAAIKTDFLDTPFYALIFVIAASLLCLLSCYLVCGSLIALVSVTVPGLYPKVALKTANDLISHRRIKLFIRLVYLVIVVAFVYVLVMLPVILIDNAVKTSFEWAANIPVISFFLLLVTCFNFVYAAAYIYLYYRRMLNYDEQE